MTCAWSSFGIHSYLAFLSQSKATARRRVASVNEATTTRARCQRERVRQAAPSGDVFSPQAVHVASVPTRLELPRLLGSLGGFQPSTLPCSLPHETNPCTAISCHEKEILAYANREKPPLSSLRQSMKKYWMPVGLLGFGHQNTGRGVDQYTKLRRSQRRGGSY